MTPHMDLLLQQTADSCCTMGCGLLGLGLPLLILSFGLIWAFSPRIYNEAAYAIFMAAIVLGMSSLLMCFASIWWFSCARAPLQYMLQHPGEYGFLKSVLEGAGR
jgi:hypothetical protein